MCNLYSLSKGQAAIIEMTRAMQDKTGNLPPMPAIFPDTMAPVVRDRANGGRELVMMRWGFSPPQTIGTVPVTNVRNTNSPYWRAWLRPEFRCLVPATSFCEWTDIKPKVTHWFALSLDRPLFCFAGIWRPWKGTRGPKSTPVEGEHLLFSFLTCESNATVRPVHAKAMPVILTMSEDSPGYLVDSSRTDTVAMEAILRRAGSMDSIIEHYADDEHSEGRQ